MKPILHSHDGTNQALALPPAKTMPRYDPDRLSLTMMTMAASHGSNSSSLLEKKTAHHHLEARIRNKFWKPTRDVGNGDRKKHIMGELQVAGQGTVGCEVELDKNDTRGSLIINLVSLDKARGNAVLQCTIDAQGYKVLVRLNGKTKSEFVHANSNLWQSSQGRSQIFWISIDKQGQVVRGGTGKLLRSMQDWEWHTEHFKEWGLHRLKGYGLVHRRGNGKRVHHDDIKLISSKYPVVQDLPPRVHSCHDMDWKDLSNNRTSVSVSELSPECQHLYANVANLKLDTSDFPDFSMAIEHSLTDPNGICHLKLLQKATTFCSGRPGVDSYDARQQYLRIAAGGNQGGSPGAPFVLEIWPPGCYSPVHEHARAHAIIKVLHGSITAFWYKSLYDSVHPYDKAVFTAGEVTWMDDRQFQTHRLFNHCTVTCVTVQSYLYKASDCEHYEYFDYLGKNGSVNQFLPSGDWEYADFKRELKEEWQRYKEAAQPVASMKTIPLADKLL